MTEKRPWPNAMRLHRDRAAEEVAAAATQMDRLLKRIRRGEFTRGGLERDLLEVTLK